MKIIILMLLLSTSSFAQFDWVKNWGRASHAVTPENVMKANCRKEINDWPSREDMVRYLKAKNFFPRIESIGINYKGVRLHDESEYLVSLLSQLTQTRFSFSRLQKCTDVICLTEAIFGHFGVFYLYTLSKYGLNLSPLSHDERIARWSPEELSLIKKTLLDFPEGLFVEKPYFKLLKNYDPHGAFMHGDQASVDPRSKIMTVYSTWINGRSDLDKTYHLFHEFSHVIDLKLGSLSRAKEWNNFSGWIQGLGGFETREQANFVSKYATVSPYEDFAESMAAYRYNPSELKKRSNPKYQFLKYVIFHGREFISASDCKREADFKRFLEKPNWGQHDLQDVTYACSQSINPFHHRTDEVTKACVIHQLGQQISFNHNVYLNGSSSYHRSKNDLWSRVKFPEVFQFQLDILNEELK